MAFRSPITTRSTKKRCRRCGGASSPLVQCDHCDTWYHLACVGVDDQSANRSWRCQECDRNNTSDPLEILGAYGGTTSVLTPARTLSPILESTFVYDPKTLQSTPLRSTTQTQRLPAPTFSCVPVTHYTTNAAQPTPIYTSPILHSVPYSTTPCSTTWCCTVATPISSVPYSAVNAFTPTTTCYWPPTISRPSRSFADSSPAQPLYPAPQSEPSPYPIPAYASRDDMNGVNLASLYGALPRVTSNQRSSSNYNQYQPIPYVSNTPDSGYSAINVHAAPPPGFNNVSHDPTNAPYNDYHQSQGLQTINRQQTDPNAMHPSFAMQMQHLLARQVIKQDLPIFSGHPEEWPLFLASFRQSTRTAGYTADENVHRLRKALKGEALLTVQGLLCDSIHVDRIIATLQQRFGQPESIIRNQIEKIRNEAQVKAEKLDSIVNFSILVANLCATMEATLQLGHVNNPLLLQELVDKLPPQLKLQWATQRMLLGQVNIRSFSLWLENMATAISSVQPYTPISKGKTEAKSGSKQLNVHNEDSVNLHDSNPTTSTSTSQPRVARTSSKSSTVAKSECKTEVCPACKKKHCKELAKCDSFKELSRNGRWNVVKTAKLCRVCFAKHHTMDCKTSKKCGIEGCEKYHHELLHSTKEAVAPVSHQMGPETVIFRIVPVTLQGPTSSVDTFAFLDDGSSVSLMDQDLATELNIQGDSKPLNLRWTSGAHRREPNSQLIKLRISPRGNNEKSFEFEARTVNDLDLPLQTVEMEKLMTTFPHLKHLPIQSYTSVKPKLLIGVDQWRLAAPLKVREGNVNDPIGTKTRLGWCLVGKIPSSTEKSPLIHHHICTCEKEDDHLESLIRKFQSIDSLGVSRNPDHVLSQDEKKAEKIMETTLKIHDGRYEVGLLWRYQYMKLPESRTMAESRLKSLERKLLSTPTLLQGVRQQLAMYAEKGYIRKVAPEELEVPNSRRWYLPIFPVQNPNKPGKLRLVWDAAASVQGVSLNSALLKGPDLYTSLMGVLLRFRQHHIAVTADIEQMFHRIYIRPEDRQSQLFMWRDCDTSREPETYSMEVMLFGATSSPYQSQYVMKHNASEYQEMYPRAVKSILQNHYVDDLLDSFETEQKALDVAKQIQKIHVSGGFKLRNWLSNSSRLYEELNESHEIDTTYQFTTPTPETEKVLGIFWNTRTDMITYSLRFNKTTKDVLNGNRLPTKRESLRTLMSCYDPLGILSHFMLGLKIMQQELWRYDITWDDPIPSESRSQWNDWLRILPEIQKLEIPRSYLPDNWSWADCVVDLITFVDASDKACCCISFLRIQSLSGKVQTSLLASKTKTAPIKPISIPRLELQSAVMGTRLTKTILENLTVRIRSVRYFTDSTTVLHWLDSRRRLQSFMACRVGEILENSNRSQWYWVPSGQNVADKGTKWDNKFVLNDEEWLNGPNFLLQDPSTWPVQSRKEVDTETEAELCIYFHNDVVYVGIVDIHRFSKWPRLLRAFAYVHRFITNCRTPKTDRKFGLLTQNELEKAEITLFLEAQRSQYPEEHLQLNDNKPISRTSPLAKLSPFLDVHKVIRMKGRIEASSAAFDTKFPIVLPRQHRITYLIIREAHQKCAHQFSETVVNEMRQRFQISRLRPLVNKVIHDCNTCHIRKARPQVPEMAPLPMARLADHCAPFTYTGVDLFGPIDVAIGRRREKRWGVIFTCLTVRAIHVEVATDLSTNAFLICLRNFTNRRGQPREMYSDRGTNFIGARKVLRNLEENFNFTDIAAKTTTPTMKWVFNPPLSPHMGGSWERLIRSIKSALKVLLISRAPTPEILYSTLVEIEFMINSRPLTYIPISGPEEPALTPNDFLLSSSNGNKVLGAPSDEVDVVRHSWQFVQNMTQRVWRKWIREYLPTLTRRVKWFNSVPNIAEGDIVVVIDDSNRKRDWPKGRVLKTHVSKDGNVRSATVQLADGIYQRPVSKLARLDVDDKESEHLVHAPPC